MIKNVLIHFLKINLLNLGPEFNKDKPIYKYIAPYPEVTYLKIDSDSINYNTDIIENISIIVGIGKNCCKLKNYKPVWHGNIDS